MVKVLQSQKPADHVNLSYFQPPEVNESCKWVSYVETINNDLRLSEVQLLSIIGRFLVNDAKR